MEISQDESFDNKTATTMEDINTRLEEAKFGSENGKSTLTSIYEPSDKAVAQNKDLIEEI